MIEIRLYFHFSMAKLKLKDIFKKNIMITNSKLKTLFLISLGFIFSLSVIIENNFNSNTMYRNLNPEKIIDNLNMKISKISGKIHIDNNWSDVKAAGICTGLGTESDPYIIEN